MSLGAVVKSNTSAPEMIDAVRRKAAFVLSDESEDRDGDIVSVKGWQLDSYRRNPVVLFNHDLKALPIGRAAEIGVRGGALRSTVEFPSEGVYPFADQVRGLVMHGFLKGVSVGFHPIEGRPRGRSKGVEFTKQELYEFSILPIPSNRNAIVEAEAKGFNVRPLYEGAIALLDNREIAEDSHEGELIQKALKLYKPTFHFGRGASEFKSPRAQAIDAEFRAAVASAVQTEIHNGRTRQQAEATVSERGRAILESCAAAVDSRTEVRTVIASGEVPLTLADLRNSIEANIQRQIRDHADIAQGRGPCGDGKTHRMGEADADEIARVQAAGALKR
jgi:HK97 family phage prohead protease